MRLSSCALVAFLLIPSGCTDFAFVLAPTPPFLKVDTWTDVPEGEREVTVKVGKTLHLPVDAASEYTCVFRPVTVNGKPPESPKYFQSDTTCSYIFRAERPGRYRVEVQRLSRPGESFRVWTITVTD
jgi:hypothetical protein